MAVMIFFGMLVDQLALTYLTAARVEWAAGCQDLKRAADAAVRAEFAKFGRSAGKAVAAINAVSALAQTWRGKLAAAAQEQARHTMDQERHMMAIQQVTTAEHTYTGSLQEDLVGCSRPTAMAAEPAVLGVNG